ncbi:MAG: RAMP superfamily CRISPR-associated protein [Candidatus Scalindua sp.]|nr:RAMP superfamily CRISPR-associated protein [Candidatus Scalindua sp.]
MDHKLYINYTISLKSKWHAGSGEGGLFSNRLVRRDTRNLPFIPGSTLKGIIRENCEKLSTTLNFPPPTNPHDKNLIHRDSFTALSKVASPVDAIFGNCFEEGNLFFRDARLNEEDLKELNTRPEMLTHSRTRIHVNRLLGTAKEKHLFSSEYTQPMEFTTTIDGYHNNLSQIVDDDPPFSYCLLIAGILLMDKICGDKSSGSGKVDTTVNVIKYNDKEIYQDKIFEYLNADDYKEIKGIS